MSTLSALIAQDSPISEEGSNPASVCNTADAIDELLGSGAHSLEQTPLGDAVNNLLLNYNQMASHFISDVGHTAPASEHTKELAEYTVKQIREACLEVSSEFQRVALEWRLTNAEEATAEDVKDLREAVTRQNKVLDYAETKMQESLEKTSQSSK